MQDGPFINLARLNVGKYSQRPNVAKALFEYLFYHENSVREALDLAAQVKGDRKTDHFDSQKKDSNFSPRRPCKLVSTRIGSGNSRYRQFEKRIRKAFVISSLFFYVHQVGKCYFRLGMFRDSEKMFKSALKQQEMIDVFLHLARVSFPPKKNEIPL